VAKDLRYGYITAAAAQKVYGVHLGPDGTVGRSASSPGDSGAR